MHTIKSLLNSSYLIKWPGYGVEVSEVRKVTAQKIKHIVSIDLNTVIPSLDKILISDVYTIIGMVEYRLHLIEEFREWLAFKTGNRFLFPDELTALKKLTQEIRNTALKMVKGLEQHMEHGTTYGTLL